MGAITLSELKSRLDKLESGLNAIMQDAVSDTAKEFADLNRTQLTYGIGSDGKFLRKYQNESYKKKKQKMNNLPPFGVADLKLTGDFHKSITVNPIATKAVPTATDDKTELLIKHMGFSNALGLNEDSLKKYRVILQPIVIRKFSEITKLEIR